MADPTTAPVAVVAANLVSLSLPRREVIDRYAARLARAYLREDGEGRKALIDAAVDVRCGSPVVGLEEAARRLLMAVGL